MTVDLLFRLLPTLFNLIPTFISIYFYRKSTRESTENSPLFKKIVAIETGGAIILTITAISMLNGLVARFTQIVDSTKVQQVPNSNAYFIAIYILLIIVHTLAVLCIYCFYRKEEEVTDLDFDGVWVSNIPEIQEGDELYHEKSDRWTFKTKNRRAVSGTIVRTVPQGEDRRWGFSGFIFGEQMLFAFAEDRVIRRSAGVMLVRKVERQDERYKGYYYEFDKRRNNSPDLLPIPIELWKERI